MLTKGNNTKQFIIAESKKLFSKKGYATVTMKDICDICGLSRGGLYRYFGSTKEIFLEILNEDKEDKNKLLAKTIKENVPAMLIFKGFLKDRKETLMLGECRGFSFAVQEFAKQEVSQREYFKKRIDQAKNGLVLLFEYGQKQKEFKKFDNETMALTMLLSLDSLEVNAYVLDFTEKEIDVQLEFLLSLVQL